jgi:hypothetical protein
LHRPRRRSADIADHARSRDDGDSGRDQRCEAAATLVGAGTGQAVTTCWHQEPSGGRRVLRCCALRVEALKLSIIAGHVLIPALSEFPEILDRVDATSEAL